MMTDPMVVSLVILELGMGVSNIIINRFHSSAGPSKSVRLKICITITLSSVGEDLTISIGGDRRANLGASFLPDKITGACNLCKLNTEPSKLWMSGENNTTQNINWRQLYDQGEQK